MKINYRTFSIIKKALLLLVVLSSSVVAQAQAPTSFTFNYTGALQTWTVPPCVNTISVDLRGAQGSGTTYGVGGLGGRVVSIYSVTSGQVLNIYVGGQSGFNGGGTGGGSYGANGGGASDIRAFGSALSNRVLVAAGGGGAGYCTTGDGGYGGGTSGGGGLYCSSSSYAGTGATSSAGGSSNGGLGTSGASGVGGNGYTSGGYGGGGGGGYYGGGGGSYGGGGGGSSFAAAGASFVTHTQGYNSGNGQVRISFDYMGTITQATLTPAIICTGNSATINTTGADTYTWSSSASTSSTVISPSVVVVSPTANTTYSVAGTNSIGCISSFSVFLQVDQAVPSLTVANTATNSSGICPGATLALTATGARTYTWNPTIVNGGTFAPTASNIYTVTGGNACGTSTAATSVSIHPTPTVTASRSTASLCSTQSAVVTGGGAVTYTWKPVPVTNGNPFYPFITQAYTVTGTSALGCTNTAQTSITVVTTPVIPPVANPTLICIGRSTTLSATGAANYSWTSTGLTGVISTNSFAISPTVTTTYSLTKWNANCYNSDSVVVVVNLLPTVFAVVQTPTVCAGNVTKLDAGGGVSYTWAPGNLPSGAGASSVNVAPQVNTIYTVTASDGTCVNTNTVAVYTNPNPVITIQTSTNSMCYGQSASYTVTGALNYTYANTPTNSPGFSGTTGVISPTVPTNYQVVGTNQYGCSGSAGKLLFVYALPTITITRTPTLVCVGFPSTLTANGAASNSVHLYSWTHGGTSNKSVVNPVVTSIYTVSGTNTVTSCQNSQTVMVAVFQPTFNTTHDTAICIKGSINLIASGATSYSWTGGPSPANNVPFYNVSPTVATIYTVSATSTTLTLKCISAKTISVGIYYQPTVTAVADRTQAICRGEAVQLTGIGANTYYWQTINQSGLTVTVSPLKETKYRVIGTDIYGCKDTFDLLVRFSNCVGFAEHTANKVNISVFPNPNNGAFTVDAPFDVALKVSNELGQVVREFTLSSGNNRNVDLTDLSPGIYFITGEHETQLINEKILITR